VVKVVVGSQNPVKMEAAKEAFGNYFSDVEIIGVEIDSKVSPQPIGERTLEGARNRALGAKEVSDKEKLGGKYFVGIEGGILELFSRWFAFSAMCIIDDKGRTEYGTSPLFELPANIVSRLLGGVELGEVIDNLVGEQETKRKQGAAGYFTKGVIDRERIYTDGLIAALVPFLNANLFMKGGSR
jgi:inosine/xanthosine triphosphatase